VITLIRESRNAEEARAALMAAFGLTQIQAQAILEMQLQRLAGLEREKIEGQYQETLRLIAEYEAILSSRGRVLELITADLRELAEKYGDARRTEIEPYSEDIDLEDLIPREDMIITITHRGYIKRLPVTTYRSQRRGGRGLTGAKTREEDFIEHLFVANTHSYILFFTDRGRCYWLKVYNAPLGKRLSKGRSILNLLDIGPQERITAFVPVDQFDPQHYVVLATRRGQIKKTPLSAFANPRRKGIWAMRLAAEDVLIGAGVTGGRTKVRAMGRGAAGVRGVTLESPEDEVVGMVCVTDPEATLLVVTEKGFGKRSRLDDYRVTNRGGRGVITVRNTPRNGPIVAIKQVGDDEEVMLTTSNGMVIRLKMSGVSVLGRATQGVRLIHLQEGDSVADVAKVALSGEPAAGEENGAAEEAGQADDGGAGADAGAGAGGAAGGGDEDEGIGEDEGGEEPDAGS